MATLNALISLIADKINRTDKNTIILQGINWVKNDLLGYPLNCLWSIGSLNTIPNMTTGYNLPSDFNLPDKFIIDFSAVDKPELIDCGSHTELITSCPFNGYPSMYHIYGNNNLMIGNETPASAWTVEVYYFKDIDDYTVAADGTDTPFFSTMFGDELFIFGAEKYVYEYLNMWDLAQDAERRYKSQVNDAVSKDMRQREQFVQSQALF